MGLQQGYDGAPPTASVAQRVTILPPFSQLAPGQTRPQLCCDTDPVTLNLRGDPMRFCLPSSSTLLIAVATASGGAAQEPGHRDHAPGGLGRVIFPVSCAPEARIRFERAMAVLHSFWWEEGERAFRAVLDADSSCAMAYWGLALNAWHNPFAGGPSGERLAEGAEAAARAASLA